MFRVRRDDGQWQRVLVESSPTATTLHVGDHVFVVAHVGQPDFISSTIFLGMDPSGSEVSFKGAVAVSLFDFALTCSWWCLLIPYPLFAPL
jgi:hypothetical protein